MRKWLLKLNMIFSEGDNAIQMHIECVFRWAVGILIAAPRGWMDGMGRTMAE